MPTLTGSRLFLTVLLENNFFRANHLPSYSGIYPIQRRAFALVGAGYCEYGFLDLVGSPTNDCVGRTENWIDSEFDSGRFVGGGFALYGLHGAAREFGFGAAISHQLFYELGVAVYALAALVFLI